MVDLQFSAEAKRELDAILKKYGDRQSSLIPALRLAQKEFGEINPVVEEYLARLLDVAPIHVHGVATFYTMFHTKPVGRHLISLCRTLSCELRGAVDIVKHLQRKLRIGNGETTPDGRFSLMLVECLGTCGSAPVMQVNEKTHENLTIEKVDEILGNLA
jgi:NADH-quinone oxidoreductase E subunit